MSREGGSYAESVVSDVESLSGVHSLQSNRRYQQAPQRPSKRRKTDNLNTRYDRMAETVHAMQRERSPPRRSRRASSASGSSSIASYDVPKTPIDAYSNLGEGRLGSSFSVINAHRPGRHGCPPPSPQTLFGAREASYEDNAPEWLQHTVASLNKNHPLRSFIPVHQPLHPPPHQPPEELFVQEEEPIFAFNPPTSTGPTVEGLSVSDRMTGLANAQTSLYKDDVITHPVDAAKELLAAPIPFSTPGPASEIPPVVWKHHPDSLEDHEDLSSILLDSATLVHHTSSAGSHTGSSPRLHMEYEEQPDLTSISNFFGSSSPSSMQAVDNATLSPTGSRSPIFSDSVPVPPSYRSDHFSKMAGPPKAPPVRIYFDSPAEDPTRSDPLERPDYELELDYDHLDFKWEKFDRSGFDLSSSSSSIPSDHLLPEHQDIQEEREEAESDFVSRGGFPPQDFSMEVQSEYGEDDADLPVADESGQHTTAFTPPREDHASPALQTPPMSPQPFAPAPGIFISPLRGDQCDSDSLPPSAPNNNIKLPENTGCRDVSGITKADDEQAERVGANQEPPASAVFPLTKVTVFKTPSPQPLFNGVNQSEEETDEVEEVKEPISSQTDSIESWSNA
ncbi:hypothetical protein BXZ70DRAFT_1068090 [Cristinia sonorae]|uniref:Uncharacterized protein n=1 Tax=Cristinia sonorae TaxID=1940300 RepID=A0A8K0XKM8_9AGAR|nr:hypothetical protein BXZ70DRAFT_1068090 [Cristinia sonorae]